MRRHLLQCCACACLVYQIYLQLATAFVKVASMSLASVTVAGLCYSSFMLEQCLEGICGEHGTRLRKQRLPWRLLMHSSCNILVPFLGVKHPHCWICNAFP